MVFEVWTRVASAEYVCILLTDGQIELYGNAFSWWCCMRHEILPIYNKTNNENLDEKMSKWTVNKISIRSSEKYCDICHIAQLILKYDSVKCLLTCISLIHELEYSICAIASHSSVCRFPAWPLLLSYSIPSPAISNIKTLIMVSKGGNLLFSVSVTTHNVNFWSIWVGEGR